MRRCCRDGTLRQLARMRVPQQEACLGVPAQRWQRCLGRLRDRVSRSLGEGEVRQQANESASSASVHAVHLLLRGRAYYQLHTEASLNRRMGRAGGNSLAGHRRSRLAAVHGRDFQAVAILIIPSRETPLRKVHTSARVDALGRPHFSVVINSRKSYKRGQMTRVVKCLIFSAALLLHRAGAQAPERTAKVKRLDEIASYYVQQGRFMGTVLVAEGDDVLLSKGYGYANLEWSIPQQPDAEFHLASLSKNLRLLLCSSCRRTASFRSVSRSLNICRTFPMSGGT